MDYITNPKNLSCGQLHLNVEVSSLLGSAQEIYFPMSLCHSTLENAEQIFPKLITCIPIMVVIRIVIFAPQPGMGGGPSW